MRTISTYFVASLFIILSYAANAQTGEMASNNTLTGKEHLTYCMIPEICVWEKIAGFEETTITETIAFSASYNSSEHQIIVKGTKTGGDVEVWDVNGNTVATKKSEANVTEIKAKVLPRGSYYISYSNGDHAEGTKLTIN
jgi:hypothetical protein